MRPTHALAVPDGGWGVEMELAYQNTWALSPEVERYLGTLEGRREIGPAELDAIRALPGENYLADFELGLLDVTFNYKFSSHWAAYLVLSGVHYGGGFLDSTIESFHDTFGFSDFGRPGSRPQRHELHPRPEELAGRAVRSADQRRHARSDDRPALFRPDVRQGLAGHPRGRCEGARAAAGAICYRPDAPTTACR